MPSLPGASGHRRLQVALQREGDQLLVAVADGQRRVGLKLLDAEGLVGRVARSGAQIEPRGDQHGRHLKLGHDRPDADKRQTYCSEMQNHQGLHKAHLYRDFSQCADMVGR
jgi:hypothetical protein